MVKMQQTQYTCNLVHVEQEQQLNVLLLQQTVSNISMVQLLPFSRHQIAYALCLQSVFSREHLYTLFFQIKIMKTLLSIYIQEKILDSNNSFIYLGQWFWRSGQNCCSQQHRSAVTIESMGLLFALNNIVQTKVKNKKRPGKTNF